MCAAITKFEPFVSHLEADWEAVAARAHAFPAALPGPTPKAPPTKRHIGQVGPSLCKTLCTAQRQDSP